MKIPSILFGLVLYSLLAIFPILAVAQSSGTRGSSTELPATSPGNKEPTQKNVDLLSLDLEELSNLKVTVTSASKKSEALSQAPAAIFVLTHEDIRRSGLSTLPEVLRLVPGLIVGKVNSHAWAISARGFSSVNNSKMLVLVDGRNLYFPVNGGVWWDLQDLPLEDVERIEVIRGPGGTLWGANAVNGVINIITKGAEHTQGLLVSTSDGIDEGYQVTARYGGKVGAKLAYRVFTKGAYWEPGADTTGANSTDDWGTGQAGMRMDWTLSPKDSLLVEGGGYEGRRHDILPPPLTVEPSSGYVSYLVRGGNFMARWRHTFPGSSSLEVLGYCDFSDRTDIETGTVLNTCDLEMQHSSQMGARHSFIWGGGVSTDGFRGNDNFAISFTPPQRRDTVVNGFMQYEIMAVPDRLRIVAGSKFEHNPQTGFEIQPQVRIVWTPKKSQTFWGAVSRAVALPAALYTDVNLKLVRQPGPVPVFPTMFGNPNLRSEVLKAYEVGYRYEPNPVFSMDATIYYNDYTHLIGLGPGGTPIINPDPFYVVVPLPTADVGPGQTHGAEVYARLRPIRRWLLSAGVTEFRGGDVASFVPEGSTSPRHQVNLQSRLDVTRRLEFDSGFYYYDAISAPSVPTHNRLDAGMSWHPANSWVLAVWGRNIQSNQYRNNLAGLAPNGITETRRSVVFKLMWSKTSGK
jgi:iron complex outermembrane receptor protein